ncbi:hypothetical protein [Streptomyces fuscichromogenes]|uniref:Lipoprotein n=1 Tax=Streptomyces fuscichromogenes TaxID=1324013 RepID=A0A918CWH8_9ACTN|nr:hypothetical protein [Streptomyces fuscichromogenes]GGN40007.1 hypothetical protein GCM10011578_087120 [Streptomyces fuscichromogenes]
MSRGPRIAGALAAALWTLTACGSDTAACELLAVVPQVSVTWKADTVPYGADADYRLCVGTHCASGAPLVYGDQVRVKVRLPEGFDERRPQVSLTLSGPKDGQRLTASRQVALRQTKEGCDQALTGALSLTADGRLRETG